MRLSVGLATTAFLESFGPDKVLGASAAQLVIGAGRPGISRGLLEDVRDALENRLWYLRLEGGRYRFTAEANLNKVVLEREGSVLEPRIVQMLRDTIRDVAPDDRVLRIVPWVHDSIDLPDDRKLTLGVLEFEHAINCGGNAEVLGHARTILEQRGAVFRTNKNAAMLLVADAHFLTRARLTARTLAALRDVSDDDHRLQRFNKDQKAQLAKRLGATTELLPQQVVMTYRHQVLLGETEGRADLDKVELGPAQAGTTLGARVVEYLRSADRLAERLAPATLLSSRFGLLPEGTDAIELDRLLAWFSQLVRLPKLASPEVLKDCLIEGVRGSIIGLVAGSRWDADDAVIRFGVPVDPGGGPVPTRRVSRARGPRARPALPPGHPERWTCSSGGGSVAAWQRREQPANGGRDARTDHAVEGDHGSHGHTEGRAGRPCAGRGQGGRAAAVSGRRPRGGRHGHHCPGRHRRHLEGHPGPDRVGGPPPAGLAARDPAA